MDHTTLVSQIVTTAHASLGRPARTSGRYPDWPAVEAVRTAALAQLPGVLLGWVPGRPVALARLVDAYVRRYVEAFGPVGDLIDAGAHMGGRRQIVEVRP